MSAIRYQTTEKKMKIGYKIKELRISKRITLEKLAEKTDLTPSFLSQLERDKVSPSIRSLEKIAAALNIKIGSFFENEGKELIFVKKGATKKIADKKVFSESLDYGFLNIKMQPQIFTLGPKAELTSKLIQSQAERFGLVFKGKVEFICDKENLILEEGDSIYCAYSLMPRKVVNIGNTAAKILWIVLT